LVKDVGKLPGQEAGGESDGVGCVLASCHYCSKEVQQTLKTKRILKKGRGGHLETRQGGS